jgi:hypothetical protein
MVGRIRFSPHPQIDLGLSFNYGMTLRTALATGEMPRPIGPPSASNPYEDRKLVYGADVQASLDVLPWGATTLRGEFMAGEAHGVCALGYILQLIQNLGPKWQAVVKYDWIGVDGRVVFPMGSGGTPIGDSIGYEGTATNLALGLIHHLDRSTRIKLFYEIHNIGREKLTGYGAGGAVGKVPFQGDIVRLEVITLF